MSEDNNQGYNPLDHSSIDDILKKRAKAKEQIVIRKEEIEDFQRCVNRIFSSGDGKYFLKKLVEHSRIHSFDIELNPAKLIEDRGRARVYLELIRPFLEKSIIAEVES